LVAVYSSEASGHMPEDILHSRPCENLKSKKFGDREIYIIEVASNTFRLIQRIGYVAWIV
jgi:hypothetical protein